MNKKRQFVPIGEVLAGSHRGKLVHSKLERLNRARLDAAGEVMQAYHWLDEVAEAAAEIHTSLTSAHNLLRRREAKLQKADRALSAYLKKEGGK